MAVCEICERGPAPEQGGVTVFRQNEPGEVPAIWRCEDCNLKRVDGETANLVIDLMEALRKSLAATQEDAR